MLFSFPQTLPSPLPLSLDEIRDLLQREVYGYLPPPPRAVSVTNEQILHDNCAGKANVKELTLTLDGDFGSFSFPLRIAIPNTGTPCPAFLLINFRPDFPDRYLPVEEVIDHGFAVAAFCYTDITSDDSDFTTGIAPLFLPNGQQRPSDCGKIAMWAWTAMRVMDYLLTLPELDPNRISVVGHSRLGKTALFCGAMDERFACAFSNDSGCGGASLSRDKTGETVARICKRFGYWFARQYASYANAENSMPFDQHFLIAANCTHKVYIASAAMDDWACPKNEFLSALAASEYYEAHGKAGLILPSTLTDFPTPLTCLHDGCIGYHIRNGMHYLSREDWNCYMTYLSQK